MARHVGLERAVAKAVWAVYDQPELLGERTHERTIVFHIAADLRHWARRALPGLSVDIEYNRWHDRAVAAGEYQAKRLGLPDLANPDETCESFVFPDLIVHRRGDDAENLLVLECKAWWSSSAGLEADLLKLRAFRDRLRYRNAVLLHLGTVGEGPRWLWLTDDDPDLEVADLRPVERRRPTRR